MSGSGNKINSSPTRAEALTVQSSTAGMCIPWVRGQHRLPGNLLWYGDFRAVTTYEKAGGKGGGGGTTEKVSYEASLLMGICHGPVDTVPRVWKGKGVSTPAALGLTVLQGAPGQAVWSPLIGRGDQALGYSGIAAVAAQRMPLGQSASVENHSFEVGSQAGYAVSGNLDIDPSDAMRELLLDTRLGAGLPPAVLASWSNWSDYCRAADLLVSPLLTAQAEAREVLQLAAELSNTAIVWSEGLLKMIPYGDQALTGNGRTYAPNLTPVYDIDLSHMLTDGTEAPLKRQLVAPADRYNCITIEYKDRSNQYAVAVAEAKDLTDISANGLRAMDTIQAHWITRGSVARLVAEIRKQRSLLVLGRYTVRLPWHFALIECMDLLTLSDAVLQLDKVPVRVVEIVEDGDEELLVTCEDFPTGVASAPVYPTQQPAGFASDALAAPPSVTSTTLFEAPGALAAGASGLEVWAAVRSPGGNWGGCTMWVSLDGGTTYRAVGRVEGGARVGQLAAALTAGATTLQVSGMSDQLISGSAADAQALSTLCYLGGSTPEYIAYQGATLTGAGVYTLTGLVRGALDTAAAAQANGAPFVRVDEGIVKSGALDDTMVGRLLHIKLTSFNIYGAAEQSLAEVSPITHTVTGRFRVRPVASGQALNANPGCDDPGAWDLAPGISIVTTASAGAVGTRAFSASAGLDRQGFTRETIPISAARRYSLTANLASAAGNNRNVYLVVRMFRADGTELDNSTTGWGGAFAGYTFGGLPAAGGGWNRYGGDFGNGLAGRPIPATVAYCRVGFWLQYGGEGSSAVEQLVQDLRLVDVTDVRAASDAAAAAQGTANGAASSAASALSTLSTMRSNGFLDAAEKPAVIREWLAIANERGGIVAQANAYGIATERDAYTAQHDALNAYLSGLSPAYNDTTTDTPITPAVDQAQWTAFYTVRQALLNRIAAVAGERAAWLNINGRPANLAGLSGVEAIRNDELALGQNLITGSDQASQALFALGYNPNGASWGTTGLSRVVGPAVGWTTANYVLGGTATDVWVINQLGRRGVGPGDGTLINGEFMAADFPVCANPSTAQELRIPVVAGRRYCFSVHMSLHRCSARVFLGFFRADGSAIAYATEDYAAEGSFTNSLTSIPRRSVVATAPAGTVTANMFIRKSDTNSGQADSWLFLAAPQLEEIGANATGPSSYRPGTILNARQVGYTGDLAATRNDVYRQASDPGAVPNGSIWLDTTTGRAQQRVAGAWQPYVGAGSVDTGELAPGAATTVLSSYLAGPVNNFNDL